MGAVGVWSHPVNLREENLKSLVCETNICRSFQKAINYIVEKDSTFPSLYTRLGLGYSFDEMTLEIYRCMMGKKKR